LRRTKNAKDAKRKGQVSAFSFCVFCVFFAANKEENCLLHDIDGAVIIAVVSVRMVQVAVHQIIDVIAVRHRFVTAAGTVYVILRMAAATVRRRACGRILRRHVDGVLLNGVPLGMVQMTVMKIIHMVAVLDGGVAAARTMIVIVVLMMMAHFLAP
jgi:hypothetical protein